MSEKTFEFVIFLLEKNIICINVCVCVLHLLTPYYNKNWVKLDILFTLLSSLVLYAVMDTRRAEKIQGVYIVIYVCHNILI